MKRLPDGNWELVNIGSGGLQCGLPADVQTGLGFSLMPGFRGKLNKGIETFVLSRSNMTAADVKISRKANYTDSSGTNWAEFCILGIPNLTGPSYGFMKKGPGEDWLGVSGAGTYQVECGLPADVQAGLGFAYCPQG